MRSRTADPVAALAVAAGALLTSAVTVRAQDEAAPPEGWQVRTDRGQPASEIDFQTMSPGFHVTTGPAAIFWNPANTAEGEFRVEAEVFLFDPGGRNEAFGLFFGGSDLAGEGQEYTYFLIRQNGGTLLKRRDGGETSVIRDWTPHDAVVTWAEKEEGESSVLNVLAVEAGAEELAFFVNGAEVARVPRGDHHADGIAGLRINHGLNVHVRSFEVSSGG